MVNIDGYEVAYGTANAFFQMRDAFGKRFPGCALLVSDGLRTIEQQWALWIAYQNGTGNLAAYPDPSAPHVRGVALDLRDSWGSPGVAAGWNERADWLRSNCGRWGFTAAGYRFSRVEPWHYEFLWDQWSYEAPAALEVTPLPPPPPPKPKEITVKTYRIQDQTARGPGRTLPAGDRFYIAADNPAARVNLIGGVGPYTITLHLYGEGEPGDAVDVQLVRTNVQEMKDSSHYIHRLTVDRNGDVFGTVTFQIDAPLGSAIYGRVTAVSTNKSPVKVTLFDSDAYLFTVQ